LITHSIPKPTVFTASQVPSSVPINAILAYVTPNQEKHHKI